jgi:hypothetical protein
LSWFTVFYKVTFMEIHCCPLQGSAVYNPQKARKSSIRFQGVSVQTALQKFIFVLHNSFQNHTTTAQIYRNDSFLPMELWPPMGHGLFILEASRSHTTTHHSRYDSSGQVISSSQRPLPDNTQHSQQTFTPPVGFEPKISAGERPQTHALDRAATGTGIS